jgi:hypothetical protein
LVDGEILTALIVIGFGVWIEKHYVSYPTVVANVLGLVITLVTIDLKLYMWAFLVLYVVLGIVSIAKKMKGLYVLLGSKTCGSLMLVMGAFSIEGTYTWLNQILMGFQIPSLPEAILFLISFVVVVLIVYLIGWIYAKVS